MDRLFDHIEFGSNEPVLKRNGEPVQEVIGKLLANRNLLDITVSMDVSVADLTASLAWLALGEPHDLGPTLTRSTPKHVKLREIVKINAWKPICSRSGSAGLYGLVAGIGQILEFWDLSHQAAQEADDLREGRFANYWHAIAHRREPDYANASYWFRIVGRHPAFAPLWGDVRELLQQERRQDLIERLGSNNSWDPFAFLDFCRDARPGTADERIARKIQRAEMIVLLEETLAAIGE